MPSSRPNLPTASRSWTSITKPNTKEEGFGDRKVFISDVWDKLKDTIGMSEAQFKDKLVQANRADQIALSRADLTAGMNSDKVERSTIHVSQAGSMARFHFIQRR